MPSAELRAVLEGFGHCYNVQLDDADDKVEPIDEGMRGCCPYEECPAPDHTLWEYRYRGFPDAAEWRLEWNPKTGTCRIVLFCEGSLS